MSDPNTTKIDTTGSQQRGARKAECKRPVLKELHAGELRPPLLIDRPVIFIGRDATCEVVLDDIKVSRRHAQITYENFDDRAAHPRVRIRDLGSTNKTFVNSAPMEEGELHDNDTILIGSTAFGFFLRDETNVRAEQRLVELASNDGLTGLRNRAYFDMALQREFARTRAHGKDLSLLLFDADHFKRVNDAHGHPAGDHVLKELGKLVGGSSRARDMCARYGGEEFAIIAPDTPLDNAAIQAERLRKAVEGHRMVFGGAEISITISVGVACVVGAMTEPAELIHAADQALYRAKQAGRNQVRRADADPRKTWPEPE